MGDPPNSLSLHKERQGLQLADSNSTTVPTKDHSGGGNRTSIGGRGSTGKETHTRREHRQEGKYSCNLNNLIPGWVYLSKLELMGKFPGWR